MSPARRSKSDRRDPGAGPDGEQPLYVFSRDAIRMVDQAAVDEFAMPSILLMEHAALALARHVQDLTDGPPARVLICCGKGNNAGDGLALARHLHRRGFEVRVVLAAPDDQFSGDAGVNLRMARRLQIPISGASGADPGASLRAGIEALDDADLAVDALLGTGVTGAPRGTIAALIVALNELHAKGTPVLAVDLPSGMDADTGEPAGGANDGANDGANGGANEVASGASAGANAQVVVADRTVTFVGLKKGFLLLPSQRWTGDICVEDIGAPMELVRRFGEPLRPATHRVSSGGRPPGRRAPPSRPGNTAGPARRRG